MTGGALNRVDPDFVNCMPSRFRSKAKTPFLRLGARISVAGHSEQQRELRCRPPVGPSERKRGHAHQDAAWRTLALGPVRRHPMA